MFMGHRKWRRDEAKQSQSPDLQTYQALFIEDATRQIFLPVKRSAAF